MKLDAFTDKTVESTEEFESQEFAIDSESLGVLFKGFSDTLYSNKIGSVVREITSNCFDSHIEAGVTRDVEIEIVEPTLSGNQAMIVFRDFGVGLSPDRVKNVYRKYFASTKRDTNNAIGGFGIGAKTPLSYTDLFTVVTRFNGTEYTYMVHRGLTVPELKLVDKVPTQKHNGTEVIITIKNNVDRYKFLSELTSQLMYFDGITYINCDIPNDYKIYQGKYFMYRADQTVHRNTHAVIGKVSYPIDFSQLGLYSWEYDVPIAVRFDIGEVAVTMTRESIEYTESTVEVMKRRIADAISELQDIYDRQVEDTDDLLHAITNSKGENTVRLADGVMVKGGSRIKGRGVTYKPFKDFHYKSFLAGDIIGKFVNIRAYITKDGTPNTTKEMLKKVVTNLFVDGKKIYRTREKITKRKSMYIAEQEGGFFVIAMNDDWVPACKDIITQLGMEKAEIIRKEVLKLVVAKSQSYDKVEISKEWLDNYLEGIRGSSAVYKDSSLVSVKSLYFSDAQTSDLNPTGSQFQMSSEVISNLANFCRKGGVIVYATYDDSELKDLINAGAILIRIPYFRASYEYRYKFEPDRIRVMKVSKETAVKLGKLPNTVSAAQFFTRYRKLVLRTLCAHVVNARLEDVRRMESIGVIRLIPGMEKLKWHAEEFVQKYYDSVAYQALNNVMDELSKVFEHDLTYRYFPKKSYSLGIDVYDTVTGMLNRLKPLVFLRHIYLSHPSNEELDLYKKQLKEYMIWKKVITKTV